MMRTAAGSVTYHCILLEVIANTDSRLRSETAVFFTADLSPSWEASAQ